MQAVRPTLFERVFGAVFETEAHLDDPLFARRQRAEDPAAGDGK
jgi:hypothetical protein